MRTIAVLACALVLSAAACGGGDGDAYTLPLDTFFEELVALDHERLDVVQPVRDELLSAFDTLPAGEPVPQSVIDGFTELYDEETQFVNAVAALAAPKEVEPYQTEAVDAHTAQIEFARGVIAQVDAETTMADLDALFQAGDAPIINQRRANACVALVEFAADHDITAELDC